MCQPFLQRTSPGHGQISIRFAPPPDGGGLIFHDNLRGLRHPERVLVVPPGRDTPTADTGRESNPPDEVHILGMRVLAPEGDDPSVRLALYVQVLIGGTAGLTQLDQCERAWDSLVHFVSPNSSRERSAKETCMAVPTGRARSSILKRGWWTP